MTHMYLILDKEKADLFLAVALVSWALGAGYRYSLHFPIFQGFFHFYTPFRGLEGPLIKRS